VNLVFFYFFDETTPNCSKAPLRWWELLAFEFWSSHFRAVAVFLLLMFEHDAMSRTTVSYSAGCEILNSHANLPSRGSKIAGLFLIYNGITVLVQWCTYSKFSTALYYNCISNLAAAGGFAEITW
jgi:hypothetical protein